MEKKNRWILVAIIAAVVAAVTTTIILVLRARNKKKQWYEQEAFDYDVDNCECFEFDDDLEPVDSFDEPVIEQ